MIIPGHPIFPQFSSKRHVYAIPFVKNDGGRDKSGFKGDEKNCTVRSLTIAAGIAYVDAHDCCKLAGRILNSGMNIYEIKLSFRKVHERFETLFEEIPCPTPSTHTINGRYRCSNHGTFAQVIRKYSKGRYLLASHNHAFAIIDGVLHDTFPVGARTIIQTIHRVTPADQIVKALPTQAQVNELWARLDALEARQ